MAIKAIITLVAVLLLISSASLAGDSRSLFLAATNRNDISSFESGNDGWTLSGSMIRSNAYPAYSGNYFLHSNFGNETATKTISTGAGNIYFWYYATNNGTSFSIDGASTAVPLNGGTWTKAGPFAVTAGSHTLVLTGAYAGRYDYITFPMP